MFLCVCVINCDLETSKGAGLDPIWVVATQEKKIEFIHRLQVLLLTLCTLLKQIL